MKAGSKPVASNKAYNQALNNASIEAVDKLSKLSQASDRVKKITALKAHKYKQGRPFKTSAAFNKKEATIVDQK